MDIERLTPSEAVLKLWQAEPCFICGHAGVCPHRQPDVDFARLEGVRNAELEFLRARAALLRAEAADSYLARKPAATELTTKTRRRRVKL